jgi:glutathione S-transferase
VVAHHQGGEDQGGIAIARNRNPADLHVTTLGSPMKLYEFAPTRSIRARWTLQELGIDFEAIPIDLLAGEHRSPAFLKINPAGKLPVLVDGDMVLTESIAIVLYLAEKYREKGLIPADLQQRAQLMRWLLFTTTELEQPLWRIARHTRLYPEEKRLPAELVLAREDFVAMARVLDEHMRDRQYVVGDAVTIADFVLAYTLDWATMVRLLDGFPRLEAYMGDMYARPRAPMRIQQAFATIKR